MSTATTAHAMTTIMVVESEESTMFPESTQRIVPDDSDSTPNSSSSQSSNSTSIKSTKSVSRKSTAKSKPQLARRVSWTKNKVRVGYRSIDQKKKVRKQAKQERMYRAIRNRVDREEGVTPQKLKYFEQLTRQNERERMRQEYFVAQMTVMEESMQAMLDLIPNYYYY